MIPLWDSQKLGRSGGAVTTCLVGVNVIVFVVQAATTWVAPDTGAAWVQHYALVPANLVRGWQTWPAWVPVGTAMFLHGGVAHVLGNGWFLWVFGRSLESHLGSARFALFYAVTGVGAALAQVACAPNSTVPMIGASGAISGVLGAYFVLLPTRWVVALVPWVVPLLPLPAFVFLLVWFGLQLGSGLGLLGGGPENVAWWAHIGGFVSGVLMAKALSPFGRSSPGRRRRRAKKSTP